jgi:hypothetical protein
MAFSPWQALLMRLDADAAVLMLKSPWYRITDLDLRDRRSPARARWARVAADHARPSARGAQRMTGFRNIALAPAGIAGTLLTGIARCKADVLPEFGQSGGRN